MIYKNGYKVVYEIAADGKRTFYATKSNAYPPRDEAGKIIENEENVQLASFNDEDFRGKTIYEYKGQFYVSKEALPAYKEDGTPADDMITGFEALFVEKPADTEELTDTVEDDGSSDSEATTKEEEPTDTEEPTEE
jgi:hypothetical protein